MKHCTNTKLIISTPNVGFLIIRLMLLLGQFNYGKRGILDMTHTRLFTFSSLRQLLEQRGFQIFQIARHPRAVSRRVGKQPAKPLSGRYEQIVSAAVSFIVFLPNARGGCPEAVVRVASTTRDRRIFHALEYARVDADMNADLSTSEKRERFALFAGIVMNVVPASFSYPNTASISGPVGATRIFWLAILRLCLRVGIAV